MPAGRPLERSLIQMGESALAVTLPSWWVKAHGLRAKGRVTVEVLADGSLRIIPGKPEVKRQTSKVIRLTDDVSEGGTVREIVASYLAGFTRIRIEYPPQLQARVRAARKVVEDAILGLTLMEEGNGFMEYYVTVDTESIGLWDSLGREFRAALAMLRDALDAAERGSVEELNAIPERDSLVDRLYLYVTRKANMVLLGVEAFHTLGLATLAEIPSIVMAAKSIERVADHTVVIARNSAAILSSGSRVPGEVLQLAREAMQVFETAGRALLSRSEKAAREVAEVIDRYPRRRIPMVQARQPEAALIVDSARRIFGYSLDIAEAVIDLDNVRQAVESLREAIGKSED